MDNGDKTKKEIMQDLAELQKQMTGGKEMDKALRASESQARTLLNLSENNIALLMDRKGILIDCNESLAKRLGKKPQEMIGKFAYDFLPPELAQSRMEKNEELFQTGKPVRYEDERNGFFYDNAVYPVFDDNGEITRIAVFAYDITDRKKAAEELAKHREHLEELVKERTTEITQTNKKLAQEIAEKGKIYGELVKNERLFRTLVGTVNEWIWETDAGGVWTYASPRVLDILGYKPEELLGKRPTDIMPPEEARRVGAILKKLAAGKMPIVSLESSCFHKDGHLVYRETDGVPFFNEAGEFMGYGGSDRDITERKRAEDSLRESETKFKKLAEKSVVGIYLLQDGLLRYVNPMFAEIFGYTVEAMIDKVRPADLVSPEDWPMVEENIGKKISGEIESFHYEFTVIRKNREIRNVEVHSSRVIHQGKPAIIGSLLDITERKKSKEELEIKSKTLVEVNIALKVLLRQREEDKNELEGRLVSNVKELVLKYMEKLQKSALNSEQRLYLRIIEENLNQIISPFLYTLKQFNLSPREAQIAFLTREGRTTKEMAQIIGIAPSAVDTYRNKIRTKLNLKKKKINLQLYLQSLK